MSPEKSDAYELGIKSTLLDRRVELNAALFYTEYKDFQASALVEDSSQGSEQSSIAFVVQNVGEVSTRGLEVDFRALLTENLALNGGVALIDATIDDFRAALARLASRTAVNARWAIRTFPTRICPNRQTGN
ncbi:MAG: TonB-dependent receptor [Haliea sp.]|nr:TonB-dependent receptor [Haliea sp.]